MASDVAEFLKKNFLESVKSNKEFSPSPIITNLLNDIENEFMENEEYWSPPPHNSLVWFYQLDNALAEFQVYNKQQTDKASLRRTFSPIFSGAERDMEKIKEALISVRKQQQNESNKESATIDSSSNSFITSSIYHPGFDEKIVKGIHKCLDSDEKFKAIGVHGMCGIGKTNLVKKIVDDERVQAKYMKPIIWVHLPDLTPEKMDIRIVKEILLCLDDDPDLLTEELEDDALVERLCHRLKTERYLIVLDGVWYCNNWFSNLFVDEKDVEKTKKCPFSMALPKDSGGAVIVTSRVKELAKQLVGEKHLFHLEPWSNENMEQFVKQCMERERPSGDWLINDVVNHCHGLPLVAGTLSGWIADQITKKASSD